MYLIVNSEYKIVDISNISRYVRRQPNGIVVLCDRADAEAIYSDDHNTYYPIERVGYVVDSHQLVEVDSVPEGIVAGYYYYRDGEYYTSQRELNELARAQQADAGSLAFVILAKDGKIDDVTIVEHANQFPEWQADVSYAQSDIVSYGGKLYRCNQAHTSQADWTPDTAVSLWKQIGDPTVEYPEWSQPLGAFDAYAAGAKVSHNGKNWVSTVDNNVWEPGVYGWDEVK